MGNPARKQSKSRRDKRRANTWKLDAPGYVECPTCHEAKLAHRVCGSCGSYKERTVVEK